MKKISIPLIEMTAKLVPGINNITITSVEKLAKGLYTVVIYDSANNNTTATSFTKK